MNLERIEVLPERLSIHKHVDANVRRKKTQSIMIQVLLF